LVGDVLLVVVPLIMRVFVIGPEQRIFGGGSEPTTSPICIKCGAGCDASAAVAGMEAAVRIQRRSIIAMAGAARYRAQLVETSRLVADRLGIADWVLVFQSRSGRPEDPWLEPDICQYLRAERARSLPAAVICPIGFVCDHVEVLYDLDVEAAHVCGDVGLPMAGRPR
jgi:ferrochelatase